MPRFGFMVLVTVVAALSTFDGFVQTNEDTNTTICDTAECRQLSATYQRYMNSSVDPCDDFYEYACGNFGKYHPLSDPNGLFNNFDERQSELEHEFNDAVNNAAANSTSHSVRYVTQLYQECNKTELLDSIGTKPLLAAIDSVLGEWPILRQNQTKISSSEHWTVLYQRMFAKLGISPIFVINIKYLSLSNRRVVMILPGSTGLDFNLLNEPIKKAKHIEAYRNYLRNVAVLLGTPDDQQLSDDIEQILALETRIANLRKGMTNKTHFQTIETLNKQADNRIDWLQTLNYIVNQTNAKVPQFKLYDHVGAGNITFFQMATKILDETPVRTIQNMFGWMTAMKYGPLTSSKFREIEHNYRTTISGSKRQVAHWESCYNFVNSKLPFAVSRVYVDSHFSPDDKKEATIMVDAIKDSFKNILQEKSWLDENTRKRAQEKLDAIKENVGYPDWILSDELDKYYYVLEDHQVVKDNFFESAVALSPLLIKNSLDGLSTPINHSLLWPMSPVTINAAYMLDENSITIPAAVLKSSFYERSRPFSINYGTVGAIVGHEMTHGFDSLGRQFDKNGQLNNWWSSETTGQFYTLAGCFVHQYSAIFDQIAQLNLRGLDTLNENIADNGGVKESFNAFRNHQTKYGKSQILPNLNLTADQLYFLGYANIWCSTVDPETQKDNILHDVHSPDKYRVNVPLENFDQFSAAYHCTKTSRMNPEEKCAIW